MFYRRQVFLFCDEETAFFWLPRSYILECTLQTGLKEWKSVKVGKKCEHKPCTPLTKQCRYISLVTCRRKHEMDPTPGHTHSYEYRLPKIFQNKCSSSFTYTRTHITIVSFFLSLYPLYVVRCSLVEDKENELTVDRVWWYHGHWNQSPRGVDINGAKIEDLLSCCRRCTCGDSKRERRH